jgi:hypothetical protein
VRCDFLKLQKVCQPIFAFFFERFLYRIVEVIFSHLQPNVNDLFHFFSTFFIQLIQCQSCHYPQRSQTTHRQALMCFFNSRLSHSFSERFLPRISRISRMRNPPLLLIRAIREIRGCLSNPNSLIHNHFQRLPHPRPARQRHRRRRPVPTAVRASQVCERPAAGRTTAAQFPSATRNRRYKPRFIFNSREAQFRIQNNPHETMAPGGFDGPLLGSAGPGGRGR